MPTIITIILFLAFLICWYKYNLFERFFTKQNRPRKFRNSFSVHSVNSTQRIVQYNRDEEEYDNEKNEDLCINNDECDGKCEDCDCELSDDPGEVTDLVLEDIGNEELFKGITMDDHYIREECTDNLGNIDDVHCQKCDGKRVKRRYKGYTQHIGFGESIHHIEGKVTEHVRVKTTRPAECRPIDIEPITGHSSNWQRRPSNSNRMSHISGHNETQYSCHLSTGLSHIRQMAEADGKDDENYEQFTKLSY